MAKQRIITAVDIGTEKVTTLIASIGDSERDIHLMGVASSPSRGLRKSQIVDLEEAIGAITESVDAAERMAGFGVKSAVVSVSGAHIESQNSKGVVAVSNPQAEITQEDVDRVIEAARAVSIPSAREIIHVIPRDYKVDSQDGIKDPVGMSGVRLEAEAHIITGSSTALRNIAKCLEETGVKLDGFVFAGLASSFAALTETERELGVVLLDIGSGSTSMCVYIEGSLAYSCVLPIGSRHVTSDLALGLRISLQSAEKIKVALSKSYPFLQPSQPGETREQARDRKKKEDMFVTDNLNIPEQIGTLSRKMLVDGILLPRLQEMFKMVGEELEKKKLFAQIPAGIVITGGGAETVSIAEVCKHALGLPTRIGKPEGLKGLTEEVDGPQFSTSTGLLLYASHARMSTTVSQKSFSFADLLKNFDIKAIPGKIQAFIKTLMP